MLSALFAVIRIARDAKECVDKIIAPSKTRQLPSETVAASGRKAGS